MRHARLQRVTRERAVHKHLFGFTFLLSWLLVCPLCGCMSFFLFLPFRLYIKQKYMSRQVGGVPCGRVGCTSPLGSPVRVGLAELSCTLTRRTRGSLHENVLLQQILHHA